MPRLRQTSRSPPIMSHEEPVDTVFKAQSPRIGSPPPSLLRPNRLDEPLVGTDASSWNGVCPSDLSETTSTYTVETRSTDAADNATARDMGEEDDEEGPLGAEDEEGDRSREVADESTYPASPHHTDEAASTYNGTIHPNGDGATVTSTRSIYEDDFDFNEENGRLYCGNYYMPVDVEERTRQYILHRLYLRILNSELTAVPLDDPENIIDIGTGIGEWVLGMAERHPDCQVWGTDIAPIQETARVWPNAWFEIDDAEQDWVRPHDFFDLVHLRHMAGAFQDWRYIYDQAFKCIKPGGFIEVHDFDEHDTWGNVLRWFPETSVIHSLSAAVSEASIRAGRLRGATHLDPQQLIDAGFVDVEVRDYGIPIGSKENRDHGHEALYILIGGIEPTALRLLTRYMDWTADMVREASERAAQELVSKVREPGRDLGFMVKFKILTARKAVFPGGWSAKALNENADITHTLSSGESTLGSESIQL